MIWLVEFFCCKMSTPFLLSTLVSFREKTFDFTLLVLIFVFPMNWPLHHTVCPRSPCPFYIVTSYIEWDKTSWNTVICCCKSALFSFLFTFELFFNHNYFLFLSPDPSNFNFDIFYIYIGKTWSNCWTRRQVSRRSRMHSPPSDIWLHRSVGANCRIYCYGIAGYLVFPEIWYWQIFGIWYLVELVIPD